MKYFVLITHKGEIAKLECETLPDAEALRRAFLIYGKYEKVEILTQA
jgi:hypothetical protein